VYGNVANLFNGIELTWQSYRARVVAAGTHEVRGPLLCAPPEHQVHAGVHALHVAASTTQTTGDDGDGGDAASTAAAAVRDTNAPGSCSQHAVLIPRHRV